MHCMWIWTMCLILRSFDFLPTVWKFCGDLLDRVSGQIQCVSVWSILERTRRRKDREIRKIDLRLTSSTPSQDRKSETSCAELRLKVLAVCFCRQRVPDTGFRRLGGCGSGQLPSPGAETRGRKSTTGRGTWKPWRASDPSPAQ